MGAGEWSSCLRAVGAARAEQSWGEDLEGRCDCVPPASLVQQTQVHRAGGPIAPTVTLVPALLQHAAGIRATAATPASPSATFPPPSAVCPPAAMVGDNDAIHPQVHRPPRIIGGQDPLQPASVCAGAAPFKARWAGSMHAVLHGALVKDREKAPAAQPLPARRCVLWPHWRPPAPGLPTLTSTGSVVADLSQVMKGQVRFLQQAAQAFTLSVCPKLSRPLPGLANRGALTGKRPRHAKAGSAGRAQGAGAKGLAGMVGALRGVCRGEGSPVEEV